MNKMRPGKLVECSFERGGTSYDCGIAKDCGWFQRPTASQNKLIPRPTENKKRSRIERNEPDLSSKKRF